MESVMMHYLLKEKQEEQMKPIAHNKETRNAAQDTNVLL